MKCLVIEDDAETLKYICRGLTEALHTVTPCDNGAEGLRQAASDHWDVLIVDRLLPGGLDGLCLVRSLRDLGKTTLIVIVSALGSAEDRVQGLRAGADDYLSKPFVLTELLARIEALMRRQQLQYESPILRVANLTLNTHTLQAARGATAIELQPRELRLLSYLMRHQDQVVTRTMLLEAVWGWHLPAANDVIDVQISRLRSKIDRGFSPALIHTVRGVGYLLGERR